MQPAGCFGRGAVRDVLAVDVQGPAPFAVMVSVETEVEAGAEVEAGVADRFDGERSRTAVTHGAVHDAAEHAPGDGVEPQLWFDGGEGFDSAVGVLDTALELLFLVARHAQAPVLMVNRVPRAVRALEQHWAPR